LVIEPSMSAHPVHLDSGATRRSAVPLAAAAIVAAVSIAVLIGRSTGSPAPLGWIGFAAMPVDTALGLFGGALGLVCIHRELRLPAHGVAALLIALGSITLVLRWLGIGFPAAHMEPNTALAFLLFGAALVTADPKRDRIHNVALGVLAGGVEVLGVFALIGQAFGLGSASGWGRLVYIAPLTAASIAVLGLGPVALAWRKAAEDRARYGPGIALAALVGMLGSILLAAMLLGQEVRIQHALLRSELARFENATRRIVDQRVRELERMARRSEHRDPTASGAWLADAESYLADADVYERIIWIDGDGAVREVAPASAAAGDSADLLRISVPLGGQGSLVATLRPQRLLERAFAEADIAAHLAVTGPHGTLYAGSGGELDLDGAETRPLQIGDATWSIRGAPGDLLVARTRSPLFALIGGVLLTLLATWALSHRRTAVERAEAIERVSDQLARSNEELGRFAYIASHDLQEPLRIVTSFCNRLAEKYGSALDETGRTYVGFIVDAAQRMGELIEGLLRYSRIEGQTQQLIAVDCNDALAEALAALHEVVSDTDAEISSDPLPSVRGNPLLLAQLFQNLVGNALKYRGDRRPRVHVAAVEQDDHWEFAVRDNGIGIDPKYQHKIFEMFERLPTPDGTAGAGIGLALCRKVVERLDGRIWVVSSAGEGSTFYFALPKQGPGEVG
jgi:signal transduction histidine kinase